VSVELPSYRLRAVHLVAVWAYGVSQPVFALLEGNPEFLAVRGLTRTGVIVFGLSLVLVPPFVAVALEWLVARVSRAGGNVLHVVFLLLFLIPVGLQVAKLVEPRTPDTALLIVWATCVGGVTAYVMLRVVRLFVSFALVLPIIGLITFVSTVPVATDDAEAAEIHAASDSAIVLLVLDELPVSSLMTRQGEIDAVRYPNFARLAHNGTWYRNATTAHDFSASAVPSILTGALSAKDQLPTYRDHPHNLFTLLGSTYELRVHESWTRLCPLALCPRGLGTQIGQADDLYEDVGVAFLHKVVPHSMIAAVPPTFTGYDEAPFDEFVNELAEVQRGTLHFVHLLLPHAPWRLLPSGHVYGFSNSSEGLEYPGGAWNGNRWLVEQAYQRHLLQVGYVDSLLGRVLRTLEQDGLYDEALVIVVADHGASFRPGVPRRSVTRENLADIAGVPLIVKYPRQRHGGADARSARTIDVLPTIADVLGARLPWQVDGRSLLGPRAATAVVVHGNENIVRAPLSDVVREQQAAVSRKSAMFGEGTDSLYRIGTHTALLGTRTPAHVRRSPTTRVRLEEGDHFVHVQTASTILPTRVSGIVEAGEIVRGTELAIAVNGRIAALGRCFRAAGGQIFRVLVPESSLRDGYNRIDVYAIDDSGSAPRLVWLGSSPDPR
jgi:hypothetical protein